MQLDQVLGTVVMRIEGALAAHTWYGVRYRQQSDGGSRPDGHSEEVQLAGA